MNNVLQNAVTPEQVGIWILIAFLVCFFVYKEWPEFKKRVSGCDREKVDTAMMDKINKIAETVEKVKEGQDDSARRIEALEQEIARQKNEISCSLEERRLMMMGLMACLDGLEQQGCNHTVPSTKQTLSEYLNNKAHT